MKNNVMMTVAFTNGQRFHRLIDGTTIDDSGRYLFRETHPDVFDHVMDAFTPNVVAFDPLAWVTNPT